MYKQLPDSPGWTVIHSHDEGTSCSLDCRYAPTWRTRLRLARERFRLWVEGRA